MEFMSIGSSFSGLNKEELLYGESSKKFSRELVFNEERQITHLLFEKDFSLFRKIDRFKIAAFKIHQLLEANFFAYAQEYAFRLEGSSANDLPANELIEKYDLSFRVFLKGSTASTIYENKEFSDDLDVDTVVEVNKLPHDPSNYFINRDFYRNVAYRAIRVLLSSISKELAVIHKPDELLENLMLFTDNSFYLISFANLDFSYKIPGTTSLDKISSTFLHESLRIQLPCSQGTIQKDAPFILDSDFNKELKDIDEVFFQKLISIPRPSLVHHNGFERLIYSMTKGWTCIEVDAIRILFLDFSIRNLTEKGSIPLERFHRILSKKKTDPFFNLNAFYNAFSLCLYFSKQGIIEAINMIPLFEEAFASIYWLRIFPKEHSLITFGGNLEIYTLMNQFHAQLSPINGLNQTKLHLDSMTRLVGTSGKYLGCATIEALTFEKTLELMRCLQEKVPFFDSILLCIFQIFPSIKIPRENILFSYFNRFLSDEIHHPQEEIEFRSLFSEFILLLKKYPEEAAFHHLYFKLAKFLDNDEAFLEDNKKLKKIFIDLLLNDQTNRLFSIFYLRICSTDRSDKDFVDEVFFIINAEKDPLLLIYKFFSFIFLVFPFDAINLIEQLFKKINKEKLHEINLDNFPCCETYYDKIDKSFWIKFLTENFLDNKDYKCVDSIIRFAEATKIFSSIIPCLFEKDLSKDVKIKIVRQLINDENFLLLENFCQKDSSILDESDLFEVAHIMLKFQTPNVHSDWLLERLKKQCREDIEEVEKISHLSELFSILNIAQQLLLIQIMIETLDFKGISLINKIFSDSTESTHKSEYKKQIRQTLFQLRKEGRFPKHLSGQYLQFFLAQNKTSPITDVDLKFCLFCSTLVNVEDSIELKIFERFIHVHFPKLLDWNKESTSKESCLIKQLFEKTLFAKKHLAGDFPISWLSECFMEINKEKSFEQILSQGKIDFPDKSFLELVDFKLNILPRKITEDELHQLKIIFSHSIIGLKSLLKHLEKYHLFDEMENVYAMIYPLISFESKYKFIRTYISKSKKYDCLSSWLVDLAQKKSSFAFTKEQNLEIGQFLISQNIELLNLSFVRYLRTMANFEKDYIDLYFEIFSHFSLENQLTLFKEIACTFQDYSPNLQNHLVLAPIFSLDSTQRNLIELARFEKTVFYYLNELVQSHLSIFLKLDIKKIKYYLEQLIVDLESKTSGVISFDAERILLVEGIKMFISLCKIGNEPISPELLNILISNILYYPSFAGVILKIILSTKHRGSSKAIIEFINFDKEMGLDILKSKDLEELFLVLVEKIPSQNEIISSVTHFFLRLVDKKEIVEKKLKKNFFKLVQHSLQNVDCLAYLIEHHSDLFITFLSSDEAVQKQIWQMFEKFLKKIKSFDDFNKIFQIYMKLMTLLENCDRSQQTLLKIFEKLKIEKIEDVDVVNQQIVTLYQSKIDPSLLEKIGNKLAENLVSLPADQILSSFLIYSELSEGFASQIYHNLIGLKSEFFLDLLRKSTESEFRKILHLSKQNWFDLSACAASFLSEITAIQHRILDKENLQKQDLETLYEISLVLVTNYSSEFSDLINSIFVRTMVSFLIEKNRAKFSDLSIIKVFDLIKNLKKEQIEDLLSEKNRPHSLSLLANILQFLSKTIILFTISTPHPKDKTIEDLESNKMLVRLRKVVSSIFLKFFQSNFYLQIFKIDLPHQQVGFGLLKILKNEFILPGDYSVKSVNTIISCFGSYIDSLSEIEDFQIANHLEEDIALNPSFFHLEIPQVHKMIFDLLGNFLHSIKIDNPQISILSRNLFMKIAVFYLNHSKNKATDEPVIIPKIESNAELFIEILRSNCDKGLLLKNYYDFFPFLYGLEYLIEGQNLMILSPDQIRIIQSQIISLILSSYKISNLGQLKLKDLRFFETYLMIPLIDLDVSLKRLVSVFYFLVLETLHWIEKDSIENQPFIDSLRCLLVNCLQKILIQTSLSSDSLAKEEFQLILKVLDKNYLVFDSDSMIVYLRLLKIFCSENRRFLNDFFTYKLLFNLFDVILLKDDKFTILEFLNFHENLIRMYLTRIQSKEFIIENRDDGFRLFFPLIKYFADFQKILGKGSEKEVSNKIAVNQSLLVYFHMVLKSYSFLVKSSPDVWSSFPIKRAFFDALANLIPSIPIEKLNEFFFIYLDWIKLSLDFEEVVVEDYEGLITSIVNHMETSYLNKLVEFLRVEGKLDLFHKLLKAYIIKAKFSDAVK